MKEKGQLSQELICYIRKEHLSRVLFRNRIPKKFQIQTLPSNCSTSIQPAIQRKQNTVDDFIIITPAFNEEQYIERTIESVLAQTCKPLLWLIVDDGSTDQLAHIVKQYAEKHPWIQYVYRQREDGKTYYESNVYAIQYGLDRIENSECGMRHYDYIAILDADITLLPDYYERIFSCFQSDPLLGAASGIYREIGKNGFKKVLHDRRSCPKNTMVFRKACFDQIGGFIPMKYGGEDTIACFTARMNRWKTWSFPDIVAIHNKPVGTGHGKGILKIRFRQGFGEYFLATHPLFMLFKSFRRAGLEPPYVVGGLIRLGGYIVAHFAGEKRQISSELIRFIRKEQKSRVFHWNRIPSEWNMERQ
jgi:glycosyltransferase involved in cell wall biosynthesis